MKVKEKRNPSQYHANVEHKVKATQGIICLSTASFVSSLPPSRTTLRCNQHYLGICALTTVSETLAFARKHLDYQTYFCGKDSFSFAVFKMQFCCETFSFAYDSCDKYSSTKERMNPSGGVQNCVCCEHFWSKEEAVLYLSAILYGWIVCTSFSLYLENESNLVITGQSVCSNNLHKWTQT